MAAGFLGTDTLSTEHPSGYCVGSDLVESNHSALVIPTFTLVGRLLRAKRHYEPERDFRRPDRCRVTILEYLGYVQQSREEMKVLFTSLAERHERRSVAITSNLTFSEWDEIVKNPLTAAAVIERVVHHSLILEYGREMKSVRAEEAACRNRIESGRTSAARDAELTSRHGHSQFSLDIPIVGAAAQQLLVTPTGED